MCWLDGKSFCEVFLHLSYLLDKWFIKLNGFLGYSFNLIIFSSESLSFESSGRL